MCPHRPCLSPDQSIARGPVIKEHATSGGSEHGTGVFRGPSLAPGSGRANLLALRDGSSRLEEGMLPTQGTAQDLDTVRVLAVLSIAILAKYGRAILKLVVTVLIATVVVLMAIGILTVLTSTRL